MFQNGLKFEGWIEKLITSSGSKGEVITVTSGIKTISRSGRGGKADPHAWQNAANAVIYVRNIRGGLCKVDSGGCAA